MHVGDSISRRASRSGFPSRHARRETKRGIVTLSGTLSIVMKTQAEIEAAISEGIGRFEQEYLGQGAKKIRAYLLKDLLVVRLHGALNAAERQLLQTSEKARGRDLLKQLRKELVETARPILVALVTEITGITVISLHHDISTVTGEEVIIFTLVEAPPLHTSRK